MSSAVTKSEGLVMFELGPGAFPYDGINQCRERQLKLVSS